MTTSEEVDDIREFLCQLENESLRCRSGKRLKYLTAAISVMEGPFIQRCLKYFQKKKSDMHESGFRMEDIELTILEALISNVATNAEKQANAANK